MARIIQFFYFVKYADPMGWTVQSSTSCAMIASFGDDKQDAENLAIALNEQVQLAVDDCNKGQR